MSTATAKARPWDKTAAPPIAPAGEPTPKQVATAPATNFAAMIDRYAEYDAAEKAAKKKKEELAEEIRSLGDGEHNGTKCKVVVSTTPTSRLDTKALKATLPDAMIAKYTTTSPVTKISVKALV